MGGKNLAKAMKKTAGDEPAVFSSWIKYFFLIGGLQRLPNQPKHIVVGDLVFLQAGDKIPADGEIIEGSLKVSQAALNGETEEAVKEPCREDSAHYEIKDLLNTHYAYRGTVVCGGEGTMEVKVVGDKTLFGELALEVQEDTRRTPLQVKLGKLAGHISTFGYIGAIAIMLGILVKTLLTGAMPEAVLT